MHQWTEQEIRIHVRAVIVLFFAMVAVAMLSKVSQQNWEGGITAYPTKTEAAIENYARELLGKMTLEQKVGQMFYAADGVDPETAAEYSLGGVLLQTSRLDNFSKAETAAVLRGYEEAGELPMLVGVNEEGGDHNTVSVLPQIRQKAFLSPRELLTTGGMKLVDSDTREKCDLLRELGVNMNFAPVCDVVTNEDAMMYPRTAQGDVDDVERYLETVLTAMHDRRVLPVLKYFPGYGDLPQKEHTDVLTDSRSIEELRAVAFPPFMLGIHEGAQAVMMGNVIVTAVDDKLPAGLSREVHKLLRRELGFEGVVISSDLNALGMGRYGKGDALAVMAVRAGCDLVLTRDWEAGIEAVLREVRSGNISVERIDESVLRILKLKISFGMME